MVVAQLVERSFPIQKSAVRIQSSAKLVLNICLLPTVLEKEAGMAK